MIKLLGASRCVSLVTSYGWHRCQKMRLIGVNVNEVHSPSIEHSSLKPGKEWSKSFERVPSLFSSMFGLLFLAPLALLLHVVLRNFETFGLCRWMSNQDIWEMKFKFEKSFNHTVGKNSLSRTESNVFPLLDSKKNFILRNLFNLERVKISFFWTFIVYRRENVDEKPFHKRLATIFQF